MRSRIANRTLTATTTTGRSTDAGVDAMPAPPRQQRSLATSVAQSHCRANLAHRLARDGAGPLGPDLDDPVHLLRVREIRLGALAPRLLLALDRLDHRLLAVQAADAGGGAAFDNPVLRLGIRVDEV